MNNETVTALAIDSIEGLTLLESAIEDNKISMKIIPLGNFSDACTFLDLVKELPAALIISSGVILREGEERLSRIIHDDRFSSMKLFILTEFEGEELHLCGAASATFIAMPNGYDEMSGVVRGIYEGALAHSGNSRKKSGQIV